MPDEQRMAASVFVASPKCGGLKHGSKRLIELSA